MAFLLLVTFVSLCLMVEAKNGTEVQKDFMVWDAEVMTIPMRGWVNAQPKDAFCFGVTLQPTLFSPG